MKNESNKNKIFNMLDELYRFTQDKMELMTFICGIEDNDVEEFTNRVKKIKSNNLEDLLEVFIDFRNEKGYKNDDVEDDD